MLNSQNLSTGKFKRKSTRTPFLPGEQIERWNNELVTQCLIHLNSLTPLTLRSMNIARAPTQDSALSAIVGRPTSRKHLHFVACRLYGSWNSALKASKIERTRTSHNKFWSKSLITASIKSLKHEGHPLTVLSIWRDRSRKTRNALYITTGKATTGSALHDAARRFYGSWDLALHSSGIQIESIKEKPFWTEKKVIRSIKILNKGGIPLNSEYLGRDCSHKNALVIQQAIGKKRVGRSLHGAAYRIFGSWDRALIAADLKPTLYRKRKFVWDIRQVGRVLNILHDFKIPVNACSLSKDYSDETKTLIFDLTGQQEPGSALYRIGNQKLGSWDATLKHSGFFLSEIRRSGSPCTRNQDALIELIRALHKSNIALNRSAMAFSSNQIKFFSELNCGKAISGNSIVNTAKELFGSWGQAIWEAGLDPSTICLRSKQYTSNLPILSHQVEDTKFNGDPSLTTYLGEPSKTPEEELQAKQESFRIDEVIATFESAEQEFVDRIFDAILQIHHYKDQNQLIKFIAQQLDYKISEVKIKEVLSRAAKHLT